MFTNAIVRKPGKNFIKGLTSANLGKPDYQLALEQHQKYIDALKGCRLEITILDADEKYPDSVFVEDTAVLTPYCAIITNPGAPSRKNEIIEMEQVLKKQYSVMESIKEPGTLDAGDVLMTENHFYIGSSDRTNRNGADQLINILKKYGFSGSIVTVESILHLKTGVSYLGNNNLLSITGFINNKEFQKFNIIPVDEDESYAANCLLINEHLLIPEGFPKTKSKIEKLGYRIIDIDVSEFMKLDGGLSCLSLIR